MPGNRGNRDSKAKEWKPERRRVTDERTGEVRTQTQDEAWADARALVRHLAALCYPHEVIGRLLRPNIWAEVTLQRHFAWELENGRMQADMEVGGVAFMMAKSGRHPDMTRWWLARRVEGFAEASRSSPGEPLRIRMIPGDETL